MTDGSSTMRTTVASMSTAEAKATPSCLKSTSLSVAKIANTATITRAALVMTPAVVVIPSATASAGGQPAFVTLPDPAEDQHVIVHRQTEEHH